MAESIPSKKHTTHDVDQNSNSDEEFEYDSSAYIIYSTLQTGAPCLSFDVLTDPASSSSQLDYPLTLYLVGGTTVSTVSSLNCVILMKLHNINKLNNNNNNNNNNNDNSDSDSISSNEYLDDLPELDNINIVHSGGINRIRSAANIPGKSIVSTWSDTGVVHIFNFDQYLTALEASQSGPTTKRAVHEPLFSFSGHLSEGFAMDWSSLNPGQMLTGDCKSNIHLWTPIEGSWHVNQHPYTAHKSSVEDVQFSPNEETVFASCGCDSTIRIWDVRAAPHKACMITAEAHTSDVNVISWNRTQPLIVSGGDDAILNIWDLRQIRESQPAATFKQHHGPITSVEWNLHDSPVFAASGEDNQVTQWDLSVERDLGEASESAEDTNIPPQLLFIHKGQNEIKELHWHPKLPGVMITTAACGFNIVKTISV